MRLLIRAFKHANSINTKREKERKTNSPARNFGVTVLSVSNSGTQGNMIYYRDQIDTSRWNT